MAYKYSSTYSTKKTPQSQPIPGSSQVENSAGGYAWAVTDWVRLDRWLILGCTSASYYASQPKLSRENAEAVLQCIKEDGPRAVARITEISDAGRAPKNSPAIFSLALAASYGDEKTKHAAFAALPKICRIGTHIFEFAEYCSGMRGWGRGFRHAIGRWYSEKEPSALAYQLLKYQQREGWSHRDLLRLSHPKPQSFAQKALYHWACKGWDSVGDEPHPEEALRQIWAMEKLKTISDLSEAYRLIRTYRLPREAVPSELLTSPLVWLSLLPDMPATALLRNLGTLAKVGIFDDAEARQLVVEKISNAEWLRRSRVHPIAVLMALRTYSQGHGVRSQAQWPVDNQVVDALDAAFYTAFKNVEPTGKRILLALDVSGSMGGGEVGGVPGLTPRDFSAALALITASTESNCTIVGFTSGHVGRQSWSSRFSQDTDGISPLGIRPGQRLPEAIKVVSDLPFGATDVSLPALYCSRNNLKVDTIIIYSDNETWSGSIHPAQALRQYRERSGMLTKMVVVGLVSNGFTVADPNDAGMLDCCGFDAGLPELINTFSRDNW